MSDEIIRGGGAIAAALGLPRRAVYHHAAAGRLPSFKIGGTLCARRAAVLAWLAACEAGTHASPALAGPGRSHRCDGLAGVSRSVQPACPL